MGNGVQIRNQRIFLHILNGSTNIFDDFLKNVEKSRNFHHISMFFDVLEAYLQSQLL